VLRAAPAGLRVRDKLFTSTVFEFADKRAQDQMSYQASVHQIEIPQQPAFRQVQGSMALEDGGFPPISRDRFVLVLEDGAERGALSEHRLTALASGKADHAESLDDL